MIKPYKDIIVKKDGNIYHLGSGYNSHDEVENDIDDRFDGNPGEYRYGTFKELGSIEIEEEPPLIKEFTDSENKKLEKIKNRAAYDNRVLGYAEYREEQKYPTTASIYTHNIRYNNCEVDISFSIKNALFDEVPVSTLDEEIEDKIRNIFMEVVDKEALYMGYDSGYAKRGRRDPYVRVYGRLKRESEKDKSLRQLYSLDFVEGIYWSTDNISPLPIYTNKNDETIDVVAVTTYVDDNDSYEKISDDVMKKLGPNITRLEEKYDLSVNQIGKVSYNREYMHVYIGVKYNG